MALHCLLQSSLFLLHPFSKLFFLVIYTLCGYYHEPDPSIIIQIDHPKLMSASIPERVSFRL